MSEFKKLFQVKRILAIALAVAMTVTSAPVTAQAAPGNPEQLETNVENDSTEVIEEEGVEDAAAGTTASVADEDGAGTESEQAAAETQENADPVDPVDADESQPAPEADVVTQADVARAAASYSFRYDGDTQFEYGQNGNYISGDGEFLNYSFLSNFRLLADDKSWEANLNYAGNDIVQTVTYQWFAGTTALGDAKLLTEAGKNPVDAGAYTLKLTLPKKDGDDGYAEVTETFEFEITKAEVTVELYTPESVTPGTNVTDVPAPGATVRGSDYKNFTYLLDDKSTPEEDESKGNEVKLTPVIKDAETGATLTEGKLAADKEYVITVVPEFIGDKKADHEKNYSFGTCDEKKLRFDDLKETRLSITLDETKYTDATVKVTKDVVLANNAERTVHVIEAQTVAAAAVDAGKPAFKDPKLETPDGTDDKDQPKWKTITADETLFEGAWYTAAFYDAPWTEADKTFCNLAVGGKLDAAPTTAGAYVYRYSYKGDEKEYKESSADILVIVEVPEIVVRPTVAEGTKFFDGQPINEVLAKIEYELPYADGRKNADGKEQLFEKTEGMWGTSYIATGNTQPYKPHYKLIVKAKDGTEIDTSDWGGKLVLVEDAEYFVRFNGQKTVYTAAGQVANTKDIMAAVDSMNPDTCGFKVKTGDDVYEAYQLKIDVVAAGSKIVTDDITAGKTSEKLNVLDVFGKTYDGDKIFENNAAYKKAKLDSGDSDSLRDFTYIWKKSTYSYNIPSKYLTIYDYLKDTVKDADGNEIKDSDGNVVYVADDVMNSFNWSVYGNPVDAGLYRLEITYKDPKSEKFAEPAYLYFVIAEQKILFDVSADLKSTGILGYTGYYDVIENNIETLEKSTSVTEVELEKPSKPEDWKNVAVTSEAADYAYEVEWAVYKKDTTPDPSSDVKDKDGNTYSEYYGYSLTTDPGMYVVVPRYGLGRTDGNGKLDYWNVNHNNNFVPVVLPGHMIPITVKEVGTDDIYFAGITTLDGKTVSKEMTYGDNPSIYDLIKDELAVLNAPITVGEDGKTKKADVTDATLTYTVEYYPESEFGKEDSKTYDKLPTEAADWAWAKDSGTYYIYVAFEGNEKYAPLDSHLATITVKQRELTLVLPTLEKTYETGQITSAALSDAWQAFRELPNAGLKGDDILEADLQYFAKPNLVWGSENPGFGVWDKEEGDYADIFMEVGDKRYSLRLSYADLVGDAAVNYYVDKSDPASTPIKVGRGASVVSMNVYENSQNKKLDIADKVSDGTAPVAKDHQVTMQDAIPYTYNTPEGNIVTITIQAPAEFLYKTLEWNKVSYKSIENQAGENLIDKIQPAGQTLSFKYNATDKEDLHFSIRWAADYNEDFTFLFSNADILDDLRDAVAPKSLAFNGPLTSMVVGQEQDLDVKITKVQMSDVICLGYEVTAGGEGNGDVMHVNEHGKVTALKEGKATVEVFPMHLVNGKKERITTDAKGKPVKSAKVNITVKKVSAPKVSKVIAHDYKVVVQYALPNKNDGYRREIYVLEGKNLKPQDFEKKLAGIDPDAMKNEQWKGIFATAPVFWDYNTEYNYHRVWDAKKHAYTNTVQCTISEYNNGRGLIPGKDYTVYVRNVSAMRSLEDDCKVTLSCAGTAKGCTTTKIEASQIVATLKDTNVQWLTDDLDDDYWYKYDDEKQPTDEAIRNAEAIKYNVPLSQKSVQISLEALFRDEAGDGEYLPLALTGDAKKNYSNPKIAYYFSEWIYDGYNVWGDYITEETGWTTTSNIGTIAKNGKMTLKNVGTAVVCAVDTVSNVGSEILIINVTAEADSITARKANMQVGQRIKLEDLVDYKEKALKLGQSYNDVYGEIDVMAAKTSLGENANFTITDDGYLIAEGVGSAEFDLKDENIDGTAHIKVSAKALDAVKGLNAVNVLDHSFDVRFEMNPYAEAYRINIKDSRGTLIRGIYVENLPFNYNGEVLWDGVNQSEYGWTPVNDVNDDDWGTEFDWDDYYYSHDRENWYSYGASCYANMIKGKMNLTYRISKLTQSSKYTVEVTTLYKEVQPGKRVTKAVTTTKLPAYDGSLIEGKIEAGKTYLANYIGISPSSGFVSGNTYTLNASYANQKARQAGTDTLTWSSSNKKVATVQATSGGYSAVLKALKDGETTIEVRSKVRKGVITRYTIKVSTVGDAYHSRDYYGENEDLRGERDPKKDLVTKLVVGVPTVIDHKDGTINYEFTATEEGIYTIYKVVKGSKAPIGTEYVYSSKKFPYTCSGSTYVSAFTGSLVVERTGSTKTTDAFANRKPVKAGEQFTAQEDAWYTFTAPEEGFYTIKLWGYEDTYYFTVYDPVKEDDVVQVGKEPGYSERQNPAMGSIYQFKKDQLVYLKANYSGTPAKIEKVTFDPLKDTATLSPNSSKWYEFTATEAGEYEFATDSDYYYNSMVAYNVTDMSNIGMSRSYDDEYNYVYSHTFTAGQKVYLFIKCDYNYNRPLTVKVSKKAAEPATP